MRLEERYSQSDRFDASATVALNTIGQRDNRQCPPQPRRDRFGRIHQSLTDFRIAAQGDFYFLL